MAVLKKEVFLVQGQYANTEGRRLDGGIVQVVVIARDSEEMMTVVKTKAAGLQIAGWATLEQYAATVAKLRAAVKGEESDWPVLVAPGMVH